MADPVAPAPTTVKATCSWSATEVDVTVTGRTVTFERQAREDHGLVGSFYRVRDTFDLDSTKDFRQQRLLFGREQGPETRVAITRSEGWRIAYNRCANDLSRVNNPMWRQVRDVANLF